MKISDIKIQSNFKSTTPSEKKLLECRQYFNKYGKIDRDIVIDKDGYLVDGYVGYLVLRENNIKNVKVVLSNNRHHYGNKYVYVFGCHSNNGREYVWRVPNKSKFKNIKVGSNVLVQTKFGIKMITVKRIKALYLPPVTIPIKKVVRCLTLDETRNTEIRSLK